MQCSGEGPTSGPHPIIWCEFGCLRASTRRLSGSWGQQGGREAPTRGHHKPPHHLSPNKPDFLLLTAKTSKLINIPL